MSTTTDVLSLFKYDPVADADSTFNITQALNNNWDKLDAAILLAIAAAGAYNPEESYAVGDYCTYKGKLRKCSTAIPTGEAWTEAHWTTTTVAAEMQELSSQLSNRLSNQYTDRVQIPDGSDFATFMVDKPYGYYYVFGEDLVEGMPTTDRVWWFIWYVPSGIFAVAADTNELFRAEFTNNYLWAWRKIAFCDKPQEFDLPITAGYEDQIHQNTYYKTQDGIVHVSFCIRKTTSTAFDSQEVFATLPAGFRPSSELARDVGGDGINLGNGIVATEIHIRSNGEMYIWGVNSQINWVYGEVSFRAAD